jgi:hypothetical protein
VRGAIFSIAMVTIAIIVMEASKIQEREGLQRGASLSFK